MYILDEFWRQYQQALFAHNYYEYQRIYLERCVRWISICSFLVTAISLAGWGITQQYAAVWSVVIFASQAANNVKDQFALNKRMWALDEYLSKTAYEIDDMSNCWRHILLEKLTESEILDKIAAGSGNFTKLEEKYIRPFGIREYRRFIRLADKKTNLELEQKHGKEDKNVETTTETSKPTA